MSENLLFLFTVFIGGLLGYMNFRHWLSDVLPLDVFLVHFPVLMSKLFSYSTKISEGCVL